MAQAFDPNRWTLRTQEAVQSAVESARGQSHPEVTPEHLLAALLGQEEGVVIPTLQRAGMAPMSVRNRVEDALAAMPHAYGGADPPPSRDARHLPARAHEEREGPPHQYPPP